LAAAIAASVIASFVSPVALPAAGVALAASRRANIESSWPNAAA
jgi:hypothetical protein